MMKRFVREVWQVAVPVMSAIALVGFSVSGLSGSVQARPAAGQASSLAQSANNSAIAALAAHLKRVGAKMYGAYWCPHCTRQKELFGAAIRDINYIECDPRGENAKPKLCAEAGVKGYPTWEINGKTYVGVQSLEELASASNYKGSRKF